MRHATMADMNPPSQERASRCAKTNVGEYYSGYRGQLADCIWHRRSLVLPGPAGTLRVQSQVRDRGSIVHQNCSELRPKLYLEYNIGSNAWQKPKTAALRDAVFALSQKKTHGVFKRPQSGVGYRHLT